jgi:S-adenosylmethionine:tRNA-ribosyltransferase-isomerase (queuine synthetase)
MSLSIEKKNKHLILNQTKLSLAKKLLGAKTETETIEMALDSIISEAEKNQSAIKANERFLKSGIEIQDVFGNLED